MLIAVNFVRMFDFSFFLLVENKLSVEVDNETQNTKTDFKRRFI
jgi:hypothetical protein